MNLVVVNTSRTGDPTGRWYANANRAGDSDYLAEERHGKVHAVYEFNDVSRPTAEGRFSFMGLNDVTHTSIGRYVKKNLDVSRVRGEANPVRYRTI